LAFGTVVALLAGADTIIAGTTVAGNSVAEVFCCAVFAVPTDSAFAYSVEADSSVLAFYSIAKVLG